MMVIIILFLSNIIQVVMQTSDHTELLPYHRSHMTDHLPIRPTRKQSVAASWSRKTYSHLTFTLQEQHSRPSTVKASSAQIGALGLTSRRIAAEEGSAGLGVGARDEGKSGEDEDLGIHGDCEIANRVEELEEY
ncbi:hypothetical protein BDV96DRAFT_140307 [Lophiotrema nucula]|uniref:Uncharacterized protein n=1 Tax=Lophiotrema nucula TaxID=690887 RepID=A0A6A5ZSG8_9PLEO|nr:hypothetical protein BDV96DRAFT_140307 [Lophiotrema nucula]